MIVVSDTSPIINLAMISRLDLLPALFGEVVIPQQVFEEITIQGPARDTKTGKGARLDHAHETHTRPTDSTSRLSNIP